MLAALAVAAAQEIDPRARALLEGLGAGSHPEEVSNMRLVSSTTMDVGGEQIATTSTTIIDYENERAVIITSIQGMETRMVIKDGTAKMMMMGMEIPMPPGSMDELDTMFDQQPGVSLVDSADRATFDGPVDYGGLLVGDQVTYEGDASLYGTPDAPVLHYVFDASGALLGMHMPTDDGEALVVYGAPLTDTYSMSDMKMYMLEGGEWTLISEMTVESLEFNTELDETLFE